MIIVTQDWDQFDYASKGMHTQAVPRMGVNIISGELGQNGTLLGTYDTLAECAAVMMAICIAYERDDYYFEMPGHDFDGWDDWEILKDSMKEDA